MNIGTAIIVNDTCVWPERVGCTGHIVAPPAVGTYPQPSNGEVLVLLHDDPLGVNPARGWTCVMGESMVDEAAP